MKTSQKYFFYVGTITVLVVLSMMLAACSPTATPTSPASSPPSAPLTQSPAATTPSAPQRQGANGAIASISGNTLTLTTAQGQATVNNSTNTIIEKTITGVLSDLAPGQTLIVTGTPDSSGNVTATTIAIRPQGQNNGFPSPGGGVPNPSGRPNGTGNGTGPRASGNPAGRGSSGILTTLDGNTLTITTAQTAQVQVIVTVAPNTVIEKTVSATVTDLVVGDYLTVFGSADSSGAINAANITDRAQGLGSGFVPN